MGVELIEITFPCNLPGYILYNNITAGQENEEFDSNLMISNLFLVIYFDFWKSFELSTNLFLQFINMQGIKKPKIELVPL